MIKPSIEKELADIDAQIAEAEQAGGARDRLSVLRAKFAPMKSRAEQQAREIETQKCRLKELRDARSNGSTRLESMRFNPARVEALAATNGSGKGALMVLLNFDRGMQALSWWLKHAETKIATCSRELDSMKSRLSALESEMGPIASEIRSLEATVARFDARQSAGHNELDPDSPHLSRRQFQMLERAAVASGSDTVAVHDARVNAI